MTNRARTTDRRLTERYLRCPHERYLASEIGGFGIERRRRNVNQVTRELIEQFAPFAVHEPDAAPWAVAAYEKIGERGLESEDPEQNMYELSRGQAAVLAAVIYLLNQNNMWAAFSVPVEAGRSSLPLGGVAYTNCAGLIVQCGEEVDLHVWRAYSAFGADDREDLANDLSLMGELAIFQDGRALAGWSAPRAIWVHPVVIGRREAEGQASPLTRAWRDPTGTLWWKGEYHGPDGKLHRAGKNWEKIHFGPEEVQKWIELLLKGAPPQQAEDGDPLETILPPPVYLPYDQARADQWAAQTEAIEQRVRDGAEYCASLPSEPFSADWRADLAGHFPQNYRECRIRGECEMYGLCWDRPRALVNYISRAPVAAEEPVSAT